MSKAFLQKKEEIKTMFCSKCGKEVAEGAIYCSNCGVKIGEICEKTELKESVQVNTVTGNQGNNEIAWREIKLISKKILFAFLVLIFWYVTRQTVISFNMLMSTEDLSIEEVFRMYIRLKEYGNEDVLGIQCLIWLLRGGIASYVFAAIFAFLKKENGAIVWAALGAICNVPVVVGLLNAIKELYSAVHFYDAEWSEVFRELDANFWIYLVLSIATFLCGVVLFSSKEENKPSNILPNGEWICADCGKTNPKYMYLCPCGGNKDKKA